MPRSTLLLLLLPVAGAGVLVLPPPLAQAQVQALPATVVSIGDGDTLRVRQGGQLLTVRLACIDAPERVQSPWGQQARRQLQTLLPVGAAVEVRSKARDRYGRLVAELSQRGRNVNQALVASGAAFVYWSFIHGCDRQTYSRLETEARLQRLGVWSVPGGIQRPWDLRRGGKRHLSTSNKPETARRYRCRDIGSFALAQQLLAQGHRYLDGDGDGVACESLS